MENVNNSMLKDIQNLSIQTIDEKQCEDHVKYPLQSNSEKINKRTKRLSLHFPYKSNKKKKRSIHRRLSLPIRFEIENKTESDTDDEQFIYEDLLAVDINESILHLNKYKIMKESPIGGGTFGSVYKCVNIQNNEEYAIKIRRISRSKYATDINLNRYNIFKHEINILKNIKQNENENKYVCHLIDYCKNATFIILELGNEICLGDMIENNNGLSEKKASELMKIMANILFFIHSNNIVHLDVKADNFVFIGGILKLIDFGEAFLGDINHVDKEGGTAIFQSPEMLLMAEYEECERYEIINKYPQIKNNGFCNFKTDFWSLGILLYFMLLNNYPFYDNESTFKADVTFDDKISNNAKDLILCLLEVSYSKRFGTNKILRHKWIV